MDLKVQASVVFSIDLSELMNHSLFHWVLENLKDHQNPKHHQNTVMLIFCVMPIPVGVFMVMKGTFFLKYDVLRVLFPCLEDFIQIIICFFTFTVNAPRERRLL